MPVRQAGRNAMVYEHVFDFKRTMRSQRPPSALQLTTMHDERPRKDRASPPPPPRRARPPRAAWLIIKLRLVCLNCCFTRISGFSLPQVLLLGHLLTTLSQYPSVNLMHITRHAPVAQLLEQTHRDAYRMDPGDLAGLLADRLGRPTVARLTGTANPNTVTKWRTRKAVPENERIDRMREAYQVFFTLVGIGLNEVNAEQWFRGKNPVLNFAMPVDVLAKGKFDEVIAAVKNFASE
jgi:hypothetical protein